MLYIRSLSVIYFIFLVKLRKVKNNLAKIKILKTVKKIKINKVKEKF